jgi:hypothetical protein
MTILAVTEEKYQVVFVDTQDAAHCSNTQHNSHLLVTPK